MTENNQDATQIQLPKKKKAARACIHCQKAHLTCDDARPCYRCIKRGLASNCTDGNRKKAKYLQDIEDASTSPPITQSNHQPQPQQFQDELPMNSIDNTFTNHMAQLHHQDTAPSNLIGNNNNSLLGLDYGFGSSATNLEYSILSNMLDPSTPPPTNLQTSYQQPQIYPNNPQSPHHSSDLWPTSQSSPISIDPLSSTFIETPTNGLNAIPTSLQSSYVPNTAPLSLLSDTPPSVQPLSIASSAIGTSQTTASGISSLSAYGDGAVVAKVASPITSSTGPTVKRRNQTVTPQMAYASVTHPFSYAEGYHDLINYVRQRQDDPERSDADQSCVGLVSPLGASIHDEFDDRRFDLHGKMCAADFIGIREIDHVLWDTDGGMAAHGGNCSGRQGILTPDSMVQGCFDEQKDIHL